MLKVGENFILTGMLMLSKSLLDLGLTLALRIFHLLKSVNEDGFISHARPSSIMEST